MLHTFSSRRWWWFWSYTIQYHVLSSSYLYFTCCYWSKKWGEDAKECMLAESGIIIIFYNNVRQAETKPLDQARSTLQKPPSPPSTFMWIGSIAKGMMMMPQKPNRMNPNPNNQTDYILFSTFMCAFTCNKSSGTFSPIVLSNLNRKISPLERTRRKNYLI